MTFVTTKAEHQKPIVTQILCYLFHSTLVFVCLPRNRTQKTQKAQSEQIRPTENMTECTEQEADVVGVL
jgi:hypothetical protein